MLLSEERGWDSTRGRHSVSYLLQPADGPGRRLQHELRVYTITELVGLHERAGLRVDAVHGDLRGAVAGPDTPLAVLTSRRP